MRAKGKSDKDCRKLADATEDEVRKSVAAQQAAIDQLDKGAKCIDTGKKDVDKAKKRLKQATDDKDKKDKALRKARSAKVDFGKYPYEDLTPGQCAVFFNSAAWKNAHSAVQKAQKAATEASGYLQASKKAHQDAVDTAKKAANKCACDVKKLHLKAVKNANAKAEAANKKAWKKAADLRCLLDGTPASKCKVTSIPTVKAVKLSKFAEGQQCSIIGTIGALIMKSGYNNAQVTSVEYTGPETTLTWDLEHKICKAAGRKSPGSTSYKNKYCAYSPQDDYVVTNGCNWMNQAFTRVSGSYPSGKHAYMCAHRNCDHINGYYGSGSSYRKTGIHKLRKGDAVFCSLPKYS